MNRLHKQVVGALGLVCLAAASVYAQSRPLWVDNPSSRFSNADIYAVGNGPTLGKAKSNAREELLKYFEVNINTSFQGDMTATSKDTSHKIQEAVAESSAGILKGITIQQTYHDEKEGYYALAVLDKAKAAADVAQEINSLDAKIKVLLEENTTGNQLEKLYWSREGLNQKYLFLTGQPLAQKVKYEEIVKKVQASPKLNFYISFPSQEYAPNLKAQLTQALTENGGIVSQEIEPANRVLKVTVTAQEEYMKVDGFVKYTVNFKVENTQDGKALGALSQSYTQTGRTPEQVYAKAAAQFATYMQENISTILK